MEKRIEHTLRSFQEADKSDVVRILVDSFKGKFHALTNLSDEKLYQLLQEAEFWSGWHHDRCLVIEMDGKVVGIMTLKWLGQKRTKRKESANVFALIRKYGLQNAIKACCGFAILNHNPKPGECYIEHIAVSRGSRGLGLGTVLLRAGENVVNQHPDLDTCSLYVSKSNTGAIRLYQSLGFEIISSQSSSLTKLFFKEPAWLYMTKRLKGVKRKARFMMRSAWPLGFLGFIGITHIHDVWAFVRGEGTFYSLFGLLWFLWLPRLVPRAS